MRLRYIVAVPLLAGHAQATATPTSSAGCFLAGTEGDKNKGGGCSPKEEKSPKGETTPKAEDKNTANPVTQPSQAARSVGGFMDTVGSLGEKSKAKFGMYHHIAIFPLAFMCILFFLRFLLTCFVTGKYKPAAWVETAKIAGEMRVGGGWKYNGALWFADFAVAAMYGALVYFGMLSSNARMGGATFLLILFIALRFCLTSFGVDAGEFIAFKEEKPATGGDASSATIKKRFAGLRSKMTMENFVMMAKQGCCDVLAVTLTTSLLETPSFLKGKKGKSVLP